MSECAAGCRTPDACLLHADPPLPLAARGLCWPCYQSDRRKTMPKKHVSSCINGRRYHSYDPTDRCKYCGAIRVF